MKDLLAAEATFATVLGSASNIHAHRAPAGDSAPKRIVVRERMDAGGREEQPSGMVKVPIQVMTESAENIQNPDKWHGAVQDDVAQFLTGQTLTMTHGETALRVRRIRVPSPVMWNAEAEMYYSTSEFMVTLITKKS